MICVAFAQKCSLCGRQTKPGVAFLWLSASVERLPKVRGAKGSLADEQPILRRLYDALCEECQKAPPSGVVDHIWWRAQRSGINIAIDILVKCNGGYAPAEPKRASPKDE